MKELSVRCENDIVILQINTRLDDALSVSVQEAFDKLYSVEKKKFIFNLKRVDFTTPNGLQMIKECIKKARKNGGDAKLCQVQSAVQKIFEYTGFADISVFCPSEKEAMKQLNALEDGLNKGETFELLGSPLQSSHDDANETGVIEGSNEDPYEQTVRSDLTENVSEQEENQGTFRMTNSPLQDSDAPYAIKMGEDGSMAIHIAPKEESVISIDGELPPIGPEDIKVLGKYGIAIITSEDNTRAAITHSGVPMQSRSKRKSKKGDDWQEETSDDPNVKVASIIKQEQEQEQKQSKKEEIKTIPKFPEEETDLSDAAFKYSGSHSNLPSLKSMVKPPTAPAFLELDSSKGSSSASLPDEDFASSQEPIPRSKRPPRKPGEGTEVTELHDCSKVDYYKQMKPFASFPMSISLPQEDIRRALNKTQSPQLFVKVTPMIPGCMAIPPYKQVDVASEEYTETTFEITPLATGSYSNGYVEVQYRGRIIEIVKTPIKIKNQINHKILLGLSSFFLLVFPLAEIIKGESRLSIAITKVFGGLAGFGLALALLLAAAAYISYIGKRPKKS